MTVVFSDLVSSTELGERLDPEVLRGVMSAYFDAMRTEVEGHGGIVEKFIGDAVMAVFGVPALHEDDALRAVRAAAGMGQVLERLNATLEARHGVRLANRTGVNTGEVVVGDPTARERLATGHAVNIAARLEQAAGSGEILLGPETFALVEGAVEAERLPPLAIKGASEPIRPWRFVGLREEPVAPPGGPFVGRDPEMAVLGAAFARASEGSCVLVTVAAPPGIGKSRLAAEFTASIAGQARVVLGRCKPYGEAMTYSPLFQIVGQLDGGARNGVEAPDGLDLVLAHDPEAGAVAARIEAVAGGAGAGSPEDTAWAYRRLFEALAADRPLVAVFDDIHWAEPIFLDLIEYIATFSTGLPMLILCLARPDLFDLRPGWATPRANHVQVHLDPLTGDETATLVDRLQASELSEADRRRVVDAAAGVPLFVEQLLALQAQGLPGEIPPTIRALLAARVDRLERDERAILERAAIVGEAFGRAALLELLPESVRSALGTRLVGLIHREFIVTDASAPGHDGFRFQHALLRDAVYEAMPKRSRAELHERYAAWLRRMGGGQEEVVGHHLETAYRYRQELGPMDAGLTELAIAAGTALATAGRRANIRAEATRGLDLLLRAERLLAVAPAARTAVLPDIVEAYVNVLNLDAAERAHAEAVSEARRLGDRTSELLAEMEWINALFYLRDDPSWPERARTVGKEAIAHFEQLGDEARLARAWITLAGASIASGDSAGQIAALEEARVHARRVGDERTEAAVWVVLGGSYIFTDMPFTEVLTFMEEELEWARARGITFIEGDGTLGLAYARLGLGEIEQARSAIARSQAIFSELPGVTAINLSETYAILGQLELLVGDPVAAEAAFREAHRMLEEAGERRWSRIAKAWIAQALIDQDRHAEASAILEELATISAPRNPRAEIVRLTAVARLHLWRGDHAEAERVARDAIARAEVAHMTQVHGNALLVLSDVLASHGDRTGANRVLRRARDLFNQKADRLGEASARRALEAL
ncbi:MAG TPA: AAA family ATPase, partial [Candidatus Limnocylindria bacterium]